MRPSVADKTKIPSKVWRRNTDPPALWISVFIGSVSLHLLAFWLMRSSNIFSLWFPQQSQSVVPIELIDITPKTKSITKSKSTAKTASPKPAFTTQKSVPARSPQIARRTTPRNQDFGARNSADNLQQKKQTYASQPNSQRIRQQRVARATPTLTPKSTPTPKPTVPVGNLPWNRRQEIKLGKGTLLPTDNPSNSPGLEAENREMPRTPAQKTPATAIKKTPATSTSQTPATPIRETARTPTQETPATATKKTPTTSTSQTPATPTRETTRTPTQETPTTSTRETPATPIEGASVAIVAPLLRNEVSSLIQSGELRQDALPDVIALYRGSNTKQLDSSFLVHNSGLEPAQLLASLIIDNNGNFQQAVVLEIEPATLRSEKSTYQRVLSEVFKTENFIAAHNNDGTKPELSNLYVRIKIQPANSN
ncbi:MAG: hypothetical protein V7L20_30455 [Nostoc sp.]|uniref:hypothetical protein n=1 Tax=Nostoc sp. TaxID=1180 RepID=UPI002FF5E1C5